jgi:hypothetical protein
MFVQRPKGQVTEMPIPAAAGFMSGAACITQYGQVIITTELEKYRDAIGLIYLFSYMIC